ncbi:hypothetical protein [Nocardioides zeae]
MADRGAALLATDGAGLRTGLDRLLDPAVRREVRAACAAVGPADGAAEVADLLVRLGAGRPTVAEPPPLGPPAWRRPALAAAGLRRGVPLVTEAPDPVAARQPVEHLLAGASPEYRARRRAAARWLYR